MKSEPRLWRLCDPAATRHEGVQNIWEQLEANTARKTYAAHYTGSAFHDVMQHSLNLQSQSCTGTQNLNHGHTHQNCNHIYLQLWGHSSGPNSTDGSKYCSKYDAFILQLPPKLMLKFLQVYFCLCGWFSCYSTQEDVSYLTGMFERHGAEWYFICWREESLSELTLNLS